MTGRLARIALSRALGPPLLVVLAFLAYALTSPGLTRGDAAGVYATAAALVERGHPAINGAIAALAPAPAGADAPPAAYGPLTYAAGHYYHNAPPGPALLAAPAYALGLALAPWLGPDAPAVLVVLLGPLLGAIAVAGLWRLARGLRDRHALVLAAAGALLLWPLAGAPTAPLVAAALLAWLVPTLRALWALGAAPPSPPDPGGEDPVTDGRTAERAQRVPNLAPARIGGTGRPGERTAYLPPG